MAWILETCGQSRFGNAVPRRAKDLFGALYSLQKDIPVWSETCALAEEVGEVVLAHARNRSELREAKIVREVVSNVVKHALEAISRQTASKGVRCTAASGVAIEQIHRQRAGQGVAVQPPRG